jgi:hypothetical protein
MYKPDAGDAIFVPMHKFRWGWTGVASRAEANTPPTATTCSHDNTAPVFQVTTDHPVWVDKYDLRNEYPAYVFAGP